MSKPIIYTSLLAKNEKLILAESTLCASFNQRVKSLLKRMLNGVIGDSIEIEDDMMITYIRTKSVLFTCVSPVNTGYEKPKKFLKQLIELVLKDFKAIDQIVPETVSKMCLQTQLEKKLNNLINDFDTGVNESKKVIEENFKIVEDIKVTMRDNIRTVVDNRDELNQMLLTSKNIENKAKEMNASSKELEYRTRFCKPWMIYCGIFTLICVIVYVVFSIYLCGSLSPFCEKHKNI
jgi:hypothetical protein